MSKILFKSIFVFNKTILLAIFLITSQLLFGIDTLSLTKTYKIGLPHVPGFTWRTDEGKVHGFPLEIVEQIAHDEQIKFEWIDGTWPVLYNKIITGEIDALPATQITEERQKDMDFLSNPLYTMWSELYISKNSEFNSLSDLNHKKVGLVVGDNNAVGFEKYIKEFELNFIEVFLESHEEGIEMLEKGEIFALVGPSNHINSGWASKVKRAGLYFNPTNLSISFPKGKNKELREKFDMRLALYKANPKSKYNHLYAKYNLSNFNKPQVVLPYWLQITIPIVLITLVIGGVFLFVLRKQIKQKTQSLKQREVYLRRAMELGNMGTWAIDIKKWSIMCSPELFDVLGINPSQEITLSYIKKLIHPDDVHRVVGVFFRSIKLANNFEFECRVQKENGELKYAKLIGLFYGDEKGNFTKVIGIVQNTTTQKIHHQQLIKAKDKAEESERLKSVFLANMSHEIRTPLNAIVGFSSIIGKQGITTEKQAEFLKIIEKQNGLLLNLINDIIDFAKIESKSLFVNYRDDVNLSAVIKNVYDTFLPQCSNNVEFKIRDNKLWGTYLLRTDEIRLKQILNNLVINAFKYTPSGEVEIGYRLNNAADCLEIYVKDTGIGIPEEHKQKIFDRFHQVDQMSQGTGLGLAICKSLANILGGSIEFESLENKGSEFTLILPYSIVHHTEGGIFTKNIVVEEVDVNTLDLTGISILIAEDNIPNFYYLQTLLTEKHALITHAKNGVEAVNMAKESDFDLVLMDIKMPLKDGLEATKEIKAFKPNLPIIAVTAYAFDADRVKAIDAGCSDYISKPVDKDELFELISLVVE